MRPPKVLALAAVVITVAGLGACGGDDDAGPDTTPTTGPTTGPTTDLDRPTGTDELAIEVGGVLAIGGDGRVYRPAADAVLDGPRGFAGPTIAPPRPPTGYTVADLEAGALDHLYERADELGVLDHNIAPDADYDWCCDRTGHLLTIATGERTLDHLVPYLDAEDLDDDEQIAVAELIVEVSDLGGDDLGTARSYVPEQWRLVTVYDMYLDGLDVPEWPLDTEPTVGDCVELPTDADRDTASGPYAADGVTIAAEPLLPWESC